MVIYGGNIKEGTDLYRVGGWGMTTKLHERVCAQNKCFVREQSV